MDKKFYFDGAWYMGTEEVAAKVGELKETAARMHESGDVFGATEIEAVIEDVIADALYALDAYELDERRVA